MNDLPSPPDSISATSDALQPIGSGASPRRPSMIGAAGVNRWLLLVLAVLALLMIVQWALARRDNSKLRTEMASRLQRGDATIAETGVIAKSVQDMTRELQAKVAVLESKQAESQSQQLALEQMYQEQSRNRDDWALAEIEQVLSTASQQLQLAGNVQGALIALQNADTRLSRSDKPQFITIRRAIATDLDKLKALPSLDITGIALRLDSVIGQIDGMPLLSDEKPTLPAAQPRSSRRVAPVQADKSGKAATGRAGAVVTGGMTADWLATVDEKWQSLTNELWTEVRQLIRVRSVDIPDALLLSPSQAYYARENLKLRLLNARLALLSRNESAFRSDMIAAQEAITKYFDTRARQTQTAQALLKQVQGSNLAIEMPTLVASLNAVRNYKARP